MDFAAKAAAFLLVKVYENVLLWCLSSVIIRNERRLYLVQVFVFE